MIILTLVLGGGYLSCPGQNSGDVKGSASKLFDREIPKNPDPDWQLDQERAEIKCKNYLKTEVEEGIWTLIDEEASKDCKKKIPDYDCRKGCVEISQQNGCNVFEHKDFMQVFQEYELLNGVKKYFWVCNILLSSKTKGDYTATCQREVSTTTTQPEI